MRMIWLIIILVPVLLSACNTSTEASLTTYIHKIKTRPALPLDKLPQFKHVEQFHYPEKKSQPNPFKPKWTNDKEGVVSNRNRTKQVLEQFPLESLSFVGVLKQESVIWALISHAGGEISYVKVGDYIGKNQGNVIRIGLNSLQLEEQVNVAGKWTKKIKNLDLSSHE